MIFSPFLISSYGSIHYYYPIPSDVFLRLTRLDVFHHRISKNMSILINTRKYWYHTKKLQASKPHNSTIYTLKLL